MTDGRWGLITGLCLLLCIAGRAEVVLFDGGVDLDQKTEIRFDVPDGCVITGLGFRANYDNITTMHCRYHRLSGDSTLIDPCEVQLGSEPNHACEAKIMLPEGFVAVGLGGAGEPEWDVTVLHIWARKLNSDGSLGPIKQFSHGFNPTRSSEDEFTLAQADRALTGAGMRFAFNNVSGLYAASKRIVAVTGEDRRRIDGFSEKIWLLQSPRSIHPDVLAEALADFKPTRLDLRCDRAALADPELLSWHAKEADIARKHDAECFAWIETIDAAAIATINAGIDSLDGIVLDTTAVDELSESALQGMYKACIAAKLKFALRVDPSAGDIGKLLASLPADVGVIVRFASVAANADAINGVNLESFAARDIHVELDLMGDEAHRQALADIHINEFPGIIYDAGLGGAAGFVVPVNIVGGFLPDSINSMNLKALHRLADDPFQSVDALWLDLCSERYGSTAAAKAVSALKRTAQANKLIFTTLGSAAIRDNGELLTMNRIAGRIGDLRESAQSDSQKAILDGLSNPTDKTVDRAVTAKDTAQWLLIQSKTDAEAAFSAAPSAATGGLISSIIALQQYGRYLADADRAYLLAQVYAIDGSEDTRRGAADAIDRMMASDLAMTPLAKGADSFARSIRESLNRSRTTAALTVALAAVEEASSRREAEWAARTLADILTNQLHSAHLGKRWQDVGRVASRLSAAWSRPENLRVLWGADGRWLLEKVEGRWCWVIGKDRPCLYLDFAGEKLSEPGEYVISFEYFDKGDWTIHFEYDSDYPDSQRRQYHPVEPLKLNNTGTWKRGSFEMSRCLFSSGENLQADMRLLTGSGAYIRDMRLEKK